MKTRKIKRILRRTRLFFWVSRLPLLILLGMVVFLLPSNYTPVRAQVPKSKPFSEDFSIAPYPTSGAAPVPFVSAYSYFILDGQSAVPILEKNIHEKLRPASITKLMTALVALDSYQLNDVVTVRRLAPVKDEVEMGLMIGDKISVRNLLYGMLVPSGNDAAFAIADNYPGGVENFIYAMNQKANVLHMSETHFANPNGTDNDNHYTSARDLMLLGREAMKNDEIRRIVATYGITLGDATGQRSYILKNVNQLLGTVSGVEGIKTGNTDLAGQCLLTSVTRNGHTIYVLVMRSQDRFGDTERLIDWAFYNTTWDTKLIRN